jgi:sulfide dehydrogenase cytochrome subunit
MNRKFRMTPGVIGAVFALALLLSCTKQLEADKAAAPVATSADAATLPTELVARGLAANCFQCHGTNGYAGELKIASMGSSEIISKFNQFRSESPRANIMNVHAYGYTTDEIQLIADYFSKQ